MLALKLALAAGSKVIITSSFDEKLIRVVRLAGAASVSTINYKTYPAWDEEVLRLNGGRGVDTLLENGGTATLLTSIKSTAKGGTVSQVGYLARQDPMEMEGLLPALIDKAIVLR